MFGPSVVHESLAHLEAARHLREWLVQAGDLSHLQALNDRLHAEQPADIHDLLAVRLEGRTKCPPCPLTSCHARSQVFAWTPDLAALLHS